MNDTNLKVLVVDDDKGAAKAIGRLLRAHGHSVDLSYGATDGVERATATRPDLILQDIAMPIIDGYEAARRLRTIPALALTVLIACSATVDEHKARQAGFDGWLMKPVGDGELQTVINLVRERVDKNAQDGCITEHAEQSSKLTV